MTDALTGADVEALLTALSKSLRAFQMYEANNPVFHRFQDALRAEFSRLWTKADALELTVVENGFGHGGLVFDPGGGRESLSFSFYKDGIRYLKFMPGFEDEVVPFLEAVRRARRREDDADDMISVLWEEDFTSFQYGYVDMPGEGLSLPETPRQEPAALPGPPLALDEAADGEEPGEEAVVQGLTREDFDGTLYFLERAELEALQREVELEAGRDLGTDVLSALFDRLEEAQHAERQSEIVEILDQLLPLFLSRGELGSAARILEELAGLMAREGGLAASLKGRVEGLLARLSDPEVLAQFVRALEEGAVSPDSEEVRLFFSRLRPDALPVLVRFTEMAEHPGVKACLASAIDGLAAENPSAVEALLVASELVLVKGGARAVGRAGLTRAVPGLEAALSHPNREVRVAAVEALATLRTTAALHALIAGLRDEDREVRIASARALGEVRFASARDALAGVLEDRRLRDADLTEKMAFYEAYGAVGGGGAVERLDRILNGKGFLGRRAPADLRACAALGLARVGTVAAQDALEKGRRDDDPVVRSVVLRALRPEAER
jgi:hypothetical protein